MSNHQENQVPKRDNSKSNFELLSKMRLRIKEKNRLGTIEANINDHLEFKKAINFLDEIEEESKFARKRSLQKSVSRGLNRLLLERNLGKLKIYLGEILTLESNNKALRKDSSEKLDTKSEEDEKRKLRLCKRNRFCLQKSRKMLDRCSTNLRKGRSEFD